MEKVNSEQRVLVLMPVGRDAELARQIVCAAGMEAEICVAMEDLCGEIGRGVGTVLFTQEALSERAAEHLLRELESQPPWSDLPLVVLVSRETRVSAHLAERLGTRANATFVERPTGAATLARAVEMGLRARRRQYELRDYLLTLARAELSEQRARAQAEEAIRVRDEFIASVAHDLKNPLGAIKGLAQLMQRRVRRAGGLSTASLEDGLTRISAMVDRAITQIDELLDAARLQAGQPLPLSLSTFDMVALSHRIASDWRGSNPLHQIQVQASSAAIPGTWDARRMERVLSNLLSNAVKYSPDGGEVIVRVEQTEDSVLISVCDQGVGIPRSDLPHIFERFYRAGNTGDLAGTGLGLAGVRQIVEQHAGLISIESEEGVGTCVTVKLPSAQDSPLDP